MEHEAQLFVPPSKWEPEALSSLHMAYLPIWNSRVTPVIFPKLWSTSFPLGKGPVVQLVQYSSFLAEALYYGKEYLTNEMYPQARQEQCPRHPVSRGGIPTALVSAPLRYMHTSVELLTHRT